MVTHPTHPIMLVDDDQASLLILNSRLRKAGYKDIIQCNDGRQVPQILTEQPVSLIILDLLMPHVRGEELLASIAADFPDLPVIVATGVEDVEKAVECLKLGAYDYLVKPVDEQRLTATVQRAMALLEPDALSRNLAAVLENPDAFAGIVTRNKSMIALLHYAEAIAQSNEPVLITGETGVGKDLLARAIHTLSTRTGAFVAVNVAGLDDTIFSDTLFGHVKGAFTGADRHRKGLAEQAAGGSLFLDEIGDLTPASQAKLLRLLQEGDYLPLGQDTPKHMDARIISATNQDLWERVKEERFRRDLNFRLRTHHIHLPPLRERPDDLPLLLDYFIEDAARSLKRRKPAMPDKLLPILQDYDFPGNVRELRAMVFNALSVNNGNKLALKPFQEYIVSASQSDLCPMVPDRPFTKQNGETGLIVNGPFPTLKTATELLVKEALRRANGNQSMAGRMLGISQQAISQRLKNINQN